MTGSPVRFGVPFLLRKKKYMKTTKKQLIKKVILIDGDNHIREGEKGIHNIPKNQEVKVYFSQEGAKSKFDKRTKNRTNVSSYYVKPGNQAVDNRIKSEAGQRYSNGESVYIVSQDKGFSKYAKKKDNAGKKIHAVKSVIDTI